MVFARLSPADKDAFFALLDEYFASRPELFGNGAASESGTNGVAAHKAAAASAASAISHALSQSNRSADAPPATNGWKRPDAATTAEISNSVGRVAAAAAALQLNGGGDQNASNAGGFPRPPPRRNPSSSNEESGSPPPEHNKLVPTRKFGDVDMSSAKNMFSSLRHSTAAKQAPPAQTAPPTPPAFQRKTDFAPPPRRVLSASGSGVAARSPGQSAAAAASSNPPPPVPRRAPEPEQEESGEWAEALYDYHSEDPGDLDLQEGARVLIVEKTSDDWWTGEMDGQRGLVPAAYVKLL